MESSATNQISMTLDTYSHLAPGLLWVGSEAMNAALRPA
jgi:hypothetical protein